MKVSSIVHDSRVLHSLAAAVAVVAVSGAGVVFSNAVANAVLPPLDGPLTLSPSSGSDEDTPNLTTPAGCPTTADSYDATVTGPNNFNGFVVNNSISGISFTGPFTTGFSNSLKAVSQNNGIPIVAGEYDIILECVNGGTGDVFRSWSIAMIFDTPTHYNIGNATSSSASPSADPSSSPSPSADPSSSPSPSADPSPSPSPGPGPSDSATTTPATTTSDNGAVTTSSDPSAGTQPVASTGNLARTGAPIALIFIGGLILLAAGLALVVWQKRPRGTASREEGRHNR